MKVLFICLDYYPQNGACTSLLNKMLFKGNLLKTLREVHVLTVKQDYTQSDIDYFNTVTIHRCLPPVILTKADILHLLTRKPFLALQGFAVKIASEARKRLSGHERISRKNVVHVLTKKMRDLEKEDYDVIIPICGHYEAAAAAMNSKWPVVLYQVDPCATNMAFVKKGHKEATLFERKLYEAATAIMTTPILYNDIYHNYPKQIVEKTHSTEFPNVSTEDIAITEQAHERITCLFAGSIYPAARNPRYTIELFNRIQDSRIQFVVAGANKEQVCTFVDKKQIGENMSFLGALPLEQAQEEIINADILVNIGNIMTNQVPSKIFEYISACKPIINICVNKDCPSIPYLEKYPLALSIVEGVGTPEEHAAEIERFIIENAGCTVDKAVVLERFKECTAEYCVEQMVSVLKSTINQ